MEIVTLTTPVDEYQITFVSMDWVSAQIVIGYKNTLNQFSSLLITGAPATTLMVAWNKQDFSTTSIHKVLLTKLNDDAILVGTISGTPD